MRVPYSLMIGRGLERAHLLAIVTAYTSPEFPSHPQRVSAGVGRMIKLSASLKTLTGGINFLKMSLLAWRWLMSVLVIA